MEIFKKYASWWLLVLLTVLGAIAYAPSFKAPFVFDDLRVIVRDSSIHMQELGPAALKKALKGPRPLASLTLALNYYFGGLDVFGFHLANLAIHVLTAFLVYLLARLTLNLPPLAPAYGATSLPIACGAALLFLLHPVNTQAVTYIVQRMTSLAALFYMGAMVSYLYGRLARGGKRALCYLGTALLGALALASKENAATLPVFIGLYEIFFFQRFRWEKIKQNMAPLGALLLLPLAVAAFYLPRVMKMESFYRYTLKEKLLTELRVLCHYLGLLFFPHPSRLNLDYDFTLSASLLRPPSTLAALVVFLGLLWAIVCFAKKKPLISFGCCWFLGNLVIESTVIPLELIYEHRLYLPLAWFFIALCGQVFPALGQRKSGNVIRAGALAALLLLLGVWTYQRNLVWGDSLSLWGDVVKKSPRNGRAHDNLALAWFRRGDYKKAVAGHLRSIELGGPGIVKKYNNLGNAYLKNRDFELAIEAYQKALQADPRFAEAYNGLGVAYNSKGAFPEAERSLKKAIELNPAHPGAYANLGMVYLNMKDYEKALYYYNKTVARHPGSPKGYFGLGKVYSGQKKYKPALEKFQAALALDPQNPNIYNSLGAVYAEMKQYDAARKSFRQALAVDGGYFAARKHLGNIYYLQGKYGEALVEWRKALGLKPQDRVLAKNIEIVEERHGAAPSQKRRHTRGPVSLPESGSP